MAGLDPAIHEKPKAGSDPGLFPSAVVVRLDRTTQYAAAVRFYAGGCGCWMLRFRSA
jgi:hypothetical protein